MMSSIPAWVYLLFIGLLYLGIKRGFTTTMKVKQLVILPIALLWLSLHGLLQSFPMTYHTIWSYILGIAIGCGLGFLHLKRIQIRADKKRGLIEIPGDWTYLGLIMAIFIIEFIIHYLMAVANSITHVPLFVIPILFISGLVVGITIGRNGCYLYKFINTSHADLS